jgi:hypothetical protein
MVDPQEPLAAKPTKVLMPIAPDERLWQPPLLPGNRPGQTGTTVNDEPLVIGEPAYALGNELASRQSGDA